MKHDLDANSSASHYWAVFRQDDNGNTFVVETDLTQAQAEQLVAEFESKGHKQLYWATADGDRLRLSSGD